MAVVVAGCVVAAGCSDDNGNGSPTAPSSGSFVSATAAISNNHNHSAVVSAEQVAAGRALQLDIRGSADHGHILDLTNDDIVRLQSRQRVDRDASPNNGHTHRVTFY
jgi:hypothetical protein